MLPLIPKGGRAQKSKTVGFRVKLHFMKEVYYKVFSVDTVSNKVVRHGLPIYAKTVLW